MKAYTLEQVTDELIGKRGSAERDIFEFEFQMEIAGKAIREISKERNLPQEELGKLIGRSKSQNIPTRK